jgi:tyrosine-protein phosphatase YwqE
MYSIFKQKPKLSNIIPEGYVDIHSHILPGIDDGAKTIEETSELLAQFISLGFSACIATPHINSGVWNNSPSIIKENYQQTLLNLTGDDKQLLVHCASEYMLNDAFIETMASEPLLTLKDNYILVELSYINPPLALKDIIFEIKHQGYQPILAHPERYIYYHRNKNIYSELKNMGLLFQLNLLSTVGYYGPAVAKIADLLLAGDKIDFVGSDIHHVKHTQAFSQKLTVTSEKQLRVALERNSFFATMKGE